MKITSRDNQKIKLARKVREGRVADLVFAEGLRLVNEILRSQIEIKESFFTAEFAENPHGKLILKNLPNACEVSKAILNNLSETKNPQGIIVICSRPETGKQKIEKALLESKRAFPLFILLHEINNPSNLGAVLRTAEAAGVSGAILTKNSSNVFSPKALRSAMGASFRLPIWTDVDFFEVLNWAHENGLVSVCADVDSKTSYTKIDWNKPRLIIFGSEAHGLSKIEKSKIKENLVIPMQNNVESLNLAVSCGIILFEANRRFSRF